MTIENKAIFLFFIKNQSKKKQATWPTQYFTKRKGPFCRNLPLEFHQNPVSNSWDIDDIEFLWGWVVGGICKVIFMSNSTKVMLG